MRNDQKLRIQLEEITQISLISCRYYRIVTPDTG